MTNPLCVIKGSSGGCAVMYDMGTVGSWVGVYDSRLRCLGFSSCLYPLRRVTITVVDSDTSFIELRFAGATRVETYQHRGGITIDDYDTMVCADRVYSIPSSARELFTVYYGRESVIKYVAHMQICICILKYRSVLPHDLICEIVAMCCELFRSNDFDLYSINVNADTII